MIVSSLKKIICDETRKSSAINILLKPVSVVLGLIYTPLLLRYLGDTQYGLWSAILSIISWINYCDVGIGHGLRNVLTKALSKKDFKGAQKAVSTAYMILTGISSVLLMISLILLFLLDWNSIFNTDVDMKVPLGISFSFICVNFVLALSNTLLYALHLSHKIALRNCMIQLLNIVGIIFLLKYTHSSLTMISILFGLTSSVIYIANTFILIKKHSCMKVSLSCFDKMSVNEIANLGIKFFVIQIACLALYAVDNVLIVNMYGGAAVTPFNIAYRLFNTAYAFLAALCAPYWSKTTDAVANRDLRWIRMVNKRLNYVSGFFIVGFILLSVLFLPITKLWLGRELEYPEGLIMVMCVYYCLYTIVTVKVQIINGTGYINFQLILMAVIGGVNVPLSIFLAKHCGLGVVGIRLATTILMLVAAIAFSHNLNQIVRKMEKNWNV